MLRVHLFRLAHTDEQVDKTKPSASKEERKPWSTHGAGRFHHAGRTPGPPFRSEELLARPRPLGSGGGSYTKFLPLKRREGSQKDPGFSQQTPGSHGLRKQGRAGLASRDLSSSIGDTPAESPSPWAALSAAASGHQPRGAPPLGDKRTGVQGLASLSLWENPSVPQEEKRDALSSECGAWRRPSNSPSSCRRSGWQALNKLATSSKRIKAVFWFFVLKKKKVHGPGRGRTGQKADPGPSQAETALVRQHLSRDEVAMGALAGGLRAQWWSPPQGGGRHLQLRPQSNAALASGGVAARPGAAGDPGAHPGRRVLSRTRRPRAGPLPRQQFRAGLPCREGDLQARPRSSSPGFSLTWDFSK